MLNYELARQYPAEPINYTKPSLVQEELLVKYFGEDMETGLPLGRGKDAKVAPGFVLQATNGAGKTAAMVLGALMRLFPRTTDDSKKEINYCKPQVCPHKFSLSQ